MPEKPIPLRARLEPKVDEKFRQHIRRRGELVKLVVLILKTIDLSTVPLLEITSKLEDMAGTTVKLPATLHGKLKRIADKRKTSMNALLNSALWQYSNSVKRNDEE
jgi:hypothetical protein